MIAAVPVSLNDARSAPSVMAYVRPGGHKAYRSNCRAGGKFSDVSAYTWRGGALGAEGFNGDRIHYWPGFHGYVTWDGRTFRNHTRKRVLVAGWCER